MTDKPAAFKTIIRRLSRRTSTKLLGLKQEELEKLETLEKQIQTEKKNMNDIITKTLSHKDPQKGKNTVYFHYLEGVWKEKESDDLIEIFNQQTSYLYKDDKAAEAQQEYHKFKLEKKIAAKNAGKEFEEKDADAVKSLRNQLTFAERTSQTVNAEIKHKNIETAKLERNKYSGMLNKWDIFDKYVDTYIIEEERKKKEDLLLNLGNKQEKKKVEEYSSESLTKPSLLKLLKLVEKQVLQTLNFMPYCFYREWEKRDVGNDDNKLYMLLPFPQNASIRNRSVTAIIWNHKYEDLFAIGYGNYKFPSKQNENIKTDEKGEERSDDSLEPGYIFIFSIKNNYFPEIKYTTESGVLSLDFNKTEPSFLVVGMYDGTVAVYDIKIKTKLPIIVSDIRYQKHMDPVWQVKWYHEKHQEDFVFFSISSDGKIYKWSFFKNKNSFEQEEILALKYTDTQNELANQGVEIDSKEKGDENLIFGNSGGMCIDFNSHEGYKHLFVCGTEEGHILLCSVKHRGHYMQTYEGHTMGVYTLAWNPYHQKIFASCSADWTIKIWHYKIYSPLIIFDIQNAVGDIAWSPWCSTIFSAVTVNGDMKFFDLNVNRKSHISEKKYGDTPINHIAFNKFEYVFLTGNDKGKVRMWRMAESLRETVDKKDEEAKEEEKKSAMKSNQPETKVTIPRNLVINNKKKHKIVVIKKDNKSKMLTDNSHLKIERDRLVEFLQLLDVKDYD
jgi:dynein intermediate chain 1